MTRPTSSASRERGGPGLMQAANEGAREAADTGSIGIRVELPFEQDRNLRLAKTRPIDFRTDAGHDRRMLELLIVVVRALTLALRGHRELVLENLALRQQLAAPPHDEARSPPTDSFGWLSRKAGETGASVD